MQIKVNPDQSKIGIDNLLLEDTRINNLHLRYSVTDSVNESRFDFVLSYGESKELVDKINKGLAAIDECYRIFNEMASIPPR